MNTHLPADLEQFVQAKVQSGRFTSPDEVIAEAVRIFRQQEEAEEARVLNGIPTATPPRIKYGVPGTQDGVPETPSVPIPCGAR